MTEPVKRYEFFAYIDDDVAELDCHEAEDGTWVNADDYARLEQECAELRAEEPEWSALQQRLGDENKRLREALQQIIDQYPNPDLSHVDYRVHACLCAEQALSAKPCAPTK